MAIPASVTLPDRPRPRSHRPVRSGSSFSRARRASSASRPETATTRRAGNRFRVSSVSGVRSHDGTCRVTRVRAAGRPASRASSAGVTGTDRNSASTWVRARRSATAGRKTRDMKSAGSWLPGQKSSFSRSNGSAGSESAGSTVRAFPVRRRTTRLRTNGLRASAARRSGLAAGGVGGPALATAAGGRAVTRTVTCPPFFIVNSGVSTSSPFGSLTRTLYSPGGSFWFSSLGLTVYLSWSPTYIRSSPFLNRASASGSAITTSSVPSFVSNTSLYVPKVTPIRARRTTAIPARVRPRPRSRFGRRAGSGVARGGSTWVASSSKAKSAGRSPESPGRGSTVGGASCRITSRADCGRFAGSFCKQPARSGRPGGPAGPG